MKQILTIILGLTSLLTGCTIRREVIIPAGNDFSTDIQRLVPLTTIAKVRELGVTIYDGRTPPNLEAIYHIAPLIMTQTSVPNDGSKIGDRFTDQRIKIHGQRANRLTASLDKKSISHTSGTLISTSTGQDALISGKGNFFSLFVVSETQRTSNSTRSRSLDLFTGEITSTGIRNLQYSLFMLEDYGDVNNTLIPVNTGRAFKDNDGFSEHVSIFRLAAPESEVVVQPADRMPDAAPSVGR